MQFDINKTAMFTGHRPPALGGYDEEHPINRYVKEELKKHINDAIKEGFKYFISGGALGVDQWAAEIVLETDANLIIARPFPDFHSKWPMTAQKRFFNILNKAYHFVDVSQGQYSGIKMHKRNWWMVDHSSRVIAVFNGDENSGTGKCVRYAINKMKDIKYIEIKKLER